MFAEDGIITETAWAKVNLTLHVGRVISKGEYKGYHPVDSLVVFADFGDKLRFAPSKKASFEISGPFAKGLEAGSDNLVMKALSLTHAPTLNVNLEKNIPVSAGLGGGSANAAAVLRRFDPNQQINDVDIGADVPVCRGSRTAYMRGIGENIEPAPTLGQISAMLVNPLIAVSTGAIFKAFDSSEREVLPAVNSNQGSLLERSLAGQNDLQPAAIEDAPIIHQVLSEIETQKGCQLARMSGSGATCFGLFATDDAARAAAESVKSSNPQWWVKSCRLGDAHE